MRCPACTFENPAGVRFCGSCGQALSGSCPACGAENPPGFRFCGSCGTALEAGGPDVATGASGGERRRVTVLFADLVGFSTLAEHLDPEELRHVVTETFGELTEEIERREGTVEKFIGDAVVAVFGAPVAHEDDPLRAAECALAMLDVVRRRSQGSPAPLELRIGVNTGLVVAGAVGDGSQTGVLGDAVNTAARLQQAASPGDVLVAVATWRQVRDRFEAEPIGSLEVKGKATPVEAFRLLGRREEELRRVAPFVGRREELALLDLLWSSARKGNTHVVSLVGEPGVGKSRLLAELPPRQDALDVRIACSGDRAFGPFLTLLEHVLGGVPSDAADLEAKAAALGLDREDALLLAAFLGLAGAPPVVRMADEQRARQVFAGVWQVLVAASRDQPVFVALDDVQWADESSRSLLAFLLEQLGGVPVMLVLLYRPGFQPHGLGETRSSHTGIRLEPLTSEESVVLARGFLGVAELPPDLERLIATRAEGNPFFIEELLRALLELGSLAVVDGRAVLARVELDIPDTVQGTILARLDRLDPWTRTVLQHAAVLGRTFRQGHLELVAGEGSLAEPLAALSRAQLLTMEKPGLWIFKHALIQEVAYDTLLLRRRRELHLKVAEALESQASDDPALLGVLAEHYARAEEREQARKHAVAAGDIAREQMGFVEAKRRYETALRLWGEGEPEGRLELLMKLASAANLAGDTPTAQSALLEAEQGWSERGQPKRAGAALAMLGRVLWRAGDADQAARVLERAIGMLEAIGPSPELVEAYHWASTLHMLQGNTEESTTLARRGLVLAEELGLTGLQAHLLNTLGSSELFAGDPGGLDLIAQALALAQETDDAEAVGRAYVNLGSTLGDEGRHEEAITVNREGREVMRRLGALAFETFIAANESADLLEVGRLDEAEALTRELLEQHRAVLGAPGVVAAAMTRLEVLVRRGDYEEAHDLLQEVAPLARGLGGTEYVGQWLTDVAHVEAARGNLGAARQAIRDAVAVSFATPAQMHWLRVLPTAARLLPAEEVSQLLGRVDKARSTPATEARLSEVQGLVAGDREASRHAADVYGQLGMPYQEARCRIDAGELERARMLVEEFGFGAGPLGQALARAEGS